MSAKSNFERLVGEEDEDLFFELFLGVSTSSVVIISDPRRLVECTSFSSRTLPFGLTFFAFELNDIVG